MANWGTMLQRLEEETVQKTAGDQAKFARCLEWAIKKRRMERFWFNEATTDITLVDGTASYGQESSTGAEDGYPADMLKYVNLTIQYPSATTWYPLDEISMPEYRAYYTNQSNKGYPDYYCFYDELFYFYDTPNAAHVVRLDYIKDIGTPINSYASEAWSTTIGGVAAADSTTNAWFVEAQNMILAEAKFHWYSKFDRNMEAGLVAKADAEEEAKVLRDQSNKAIIQRSVRPWC